MVHLLLVMLRKKVSLLVSKHLYIVYVPTLEVGSLIHISTASTVAYYADLKMFVG
jgi:hypothetical protein